MNTTRLATSARLIAGSSVSTRLRDDRPVIIRAATLDDTGDVVAMHTRCSLESVRRRYHSVPAMTGRFLSQLLSTDITLVAQAPNRAIVALGNLGRDADGSGELAVIVEDGWQRVGLGSGMLEHLVLMAHLTGYDDVHTVCVPGQRCFFGTLARFGPVQHERSQDDETMRLSLGSIRDCRPVPA